MGNHTKQNENQMREGEIKNLKMKIKQLEIQLSNLKQEKSNTFKSMEEIIDCKDTELKFQVSYIIIQLKISKRVHL